MMFSDPCLQIKIPQMRKLYKSLFSKGKALRSKITKQTADFLNISKAQQQKLSHIIECIHHSSILHDDVIDMSPKRRGELSTWVYFSMKKSILAGDYLLAQSAWDAASMNCLPLMRLTAQTLKKLVLGEWLQDSLKGEETIKSLNQVHALKTASLFQWCLQAPFLIAGFENKKIYHTLDKLGLLMGTVFQRSDDLLDFNIRNKENKIHFKDLTEGHLNSFACFLSLKKKKNFREALKKCRNLKEVKTCVGGKDIFNKKLCAYDAINNLYIEKAYKQIDTLKPYLALKAKTSTLFLKQLKNWSYNLYWRKNV